jgi:hypothetical protein
MPVYLMYAIATATSTTNCLLPAGYDPYRSSGAQVPGRGPVRHRDGQLAPRHLRLAATWSEVVDMGVSLSDVRQAHKRKVEPAQLLEVF